MVRKTILRIVHGVRAITIGQVALYLGLLLLFVIWFTPQFFDWLIEERVSWTEPVQLPDGVSIQVRRKLTFDHKPSSEQDHGHPMWERLEIPHPDGHNAKPIIWESSNREGVMAVALYFEHGLPRVVTVDTGPGDSTFGCSYTEGERLFLWSPDKGWRYDPYSRMDINYVGPINLTPPNYFAVIKGLREGFPMQKGWTIDTQHERTICKTPRYKQLTLEQVLAHTRISE
jgi:hypothetical protein